MEHVQRRRRRPRPRRNSPPPDAFSRDAEWKAFETVRKNRDACISFLVKLAQRIEREWDDTPSRLGRLGLLRDALETLSTHTHADCRELAALAPRMLRDLNCDQRHFLNLALPIERKFSKGLVDHDFLVTTDDGGTGTGAAASTAQKQPLTLVLDHLRSAFNVGAIFRTADCLGISRLVLCGYTATPDDAQVQRTTMGAHAHVAWEWKKNTAAAVDELRAAGVPVVALETVEGAPLVDEYEWPSGCALLLGNERHGLDAALLRKCDAVVRLPALGVKNSMNVGVALGMCGHEILRQWRAKARRAAADGDGAPEKRARRDVDAG